MNTSVNSEELFFSQNGYLIKEGLLEEHLSEEVCKSLEDYGQGSFGMYSTINNNKMIDILFHKKTHELLESIFGSEKYSLHHITSALHTKQTPSLAWHHDQVPTYSNNRKGLMVHCLIYPSGMNNEIGELLIIPGSHKWEVDRYQLAKIPFSALNKKTINKLGKGSVVFVDSSLIHARRSLAAKSKSSKRHFIDMSYCDGNLRWEPYLEAKETWSNLFDTILEKMPVSMHNRIGILDKEPYKNNNMIGILPGRIQKIYYLFKSYWYRKIISQKFSKIES